MGCGRRSSGELTPMPFQPGFRGKPLPPAVWQQSAAAWQDAATDSEYLFYLTPEELEQLNEGYRDQAAGLTVRGLLEHSRG